MASPSPDPFLEPNSCAPSQPAPAPAKRSLFKNRKPKVVKITEQEAAEAVDFFSRSKEIFPEAMREKRERRERVERRKAEREEVRKRELEEEDAVRQRRHALDNEGSQDEFIAEGQGRRSKSRSYSQTRSTPPPRHRSTSRDSLAQIPAGSPPHKRRSPHNERLTRSQASKPIISLSSDSDSDSDPDIKLAKQRSLAMGRREEQHENAAGYDAYASSPPRATGAAQKRRSPSVEEISQEDEMFPELVAAARAQAAAEQAEKLKAMQRRLGRTKSASSNGSGSPRDPGSVDSPGPMPSSPLATRDAPREDPIISIYVDSRVEDLREPIIVKRKLSQRFKDVRMAWCDKQVIRGYRNMSDVEKELIFLSWRGRRVWDVTTAESLGIKVDGRGHVVDEKGQDLGGNLHLEAWTGDAYEQFLREKKAEKQRLAGGGAFGQGERVDLDDDDEAPGSDAVEAATVLAAEEPKKIKIILKARVGEPVKLIVKTTTLVETVVKGFKAQRPELCEGKSVELWFDGERLGEETSVGEADVEDMSGIDVVLKDA